MQTCAPIPYYRPPNPTLRRLQGAEFTPCLNPISNAGGPVPPDPVPCRPRDSEAEAGELSSGALEQAEWDDDSAAAEKGRRHQWEAARARAAGTRERGLLGKRPAAAPARPSLAPGSPPARRPGLAARQEPRRGARAGGEPRPRGPGSREGGSQGDRGGGRQGACALQGRQIWREGECPKLFV